MTGKRRLLIRAKRKIDVGKLTYKARWWDQGGTLGYQSGFFKYKPLYLAEEAWIKGPHLVKFEQENENMTPV